MKKLIAGAVIGAVVVGGIWFFTGTDKTIATVGGEKITYSAFYKQMETQGGKDVLKTLIDNQVIKNAAKKDNITVTDKEIQTEIDNLIKDRFQGDKTKFDQALKDYNMQLSDLQDNIRTTLLAKKIATKDIKISDQEIKDYYDKNKETLGTQEQVHARHILVKDEAKAKEIVAQLKANPNDFEKLAKQYSEDPGTKDKGGDLGTFGKGAMVKEFEDAAFKAKVNDIVGPVKSEFGYHIIQVLQHQDAKIPTLDEVKSKIVDTLQQQKAKPMQDLVTELEKNEKISIVPEQYKHILDPAPAQQGQDGTTQPAQGGTTQPAQGGTATTPTTGTDSTKK